MSHSLKTATSFPAERASAGQKAEEAFLQEHGGSGPRALFRSVEAITASGPALRRLLAGTSLPSLKLRGSLVSKQERSV
ncbi:MAG: hypothetical protein QNJ09_01980 [Paracoccaceae bacterium]|nr:hypothetical protein [Paracoccaceae bacterium]